MRRFRMFAAAIAALVLAAPAPAGAATRWFVEFEGAPAAEGASPAALQDDHRRFTSEARAEGIAYRERFTYRTLFNGVAVDAGARAIADLGALDGVAAVYPVETVKLDQTAPAFEPD